jgi:hypothetical protein
MKLIYDMRLNLEVDPLELWGLGEQFLGFLSLLFFFLQCLWG